MRNGRSHFHITPQPPYLCRMKTITILSGAGMSAESGIPTFRGSDGLWEGHDVRQVASPHGWRRDPAMVLEFYNQRRRNMTASYPNAGHLALKDLEARHFVQIVTQNIDNLHERAGSTQVLHLHGEIMKARSTYSPDLVYELQPGQDILIGDTCELGSQLRPHIVWFEEDVPMMAEAIKQVEASDIVVIVGTSMVVSPANTLVSFAHPHVPVYIVDPQRPKGVYGRDFHFIEEPASTGLRKLVDKFLSED